ncbi:MAG: hypothetical protein ACW991_00700 [Candidatus Hodarchaeales archaeon]|jgi:hypothetical protein
MVETIQMRGFTQLNNKLSKLELDIPRAILKDSKRIALDYKRGLIDEIKAKDLRWHGFLEKVRIQKNGDKGHLILMREYGPKLDKMKPHFAPLGDPILRQWVEENLEPDPDHSGKGGRKGYLWVEPHPFIDAGLRRGRKKIKDRLRTGEVVRIVKKKR